MNHPVASPFLPSLSARHSTMLAEMGVPLWWQQPTGTASAPPKAAVAQLPPATTAATATSPIAERSASAPSVPPRPAVTPRTADTPRLVPLLTRSGEFDALDQTQLDAAIRACQRCDLGQRRQQAVPGMGDPAPDWLIVGEAPGEEEDRQGLPFVGRAGHLLDKMLAAMDLTREHKVHIANVIKCRPPHNRNPDPVEIAQCTPYLLRQVALLRPRIILAMGRFAAHTVLAEGGRFPATTLQQMPLGKLRGQVHEVTLGSLTLPVVVTYHPAYLLRSPAEKGKAWADLCLAMDTLDNLHPR